ncbi:MAG: type II toxin-antitoxin system RelE/ParE family toxin [Candidatus Omnitrophica bacterium]|nr:type II toxin-antitoxin system RelE/ParE family toxin [Candidatus Omnitrophota bacterium]
MADIGHIYDETKFRIEDRQHKIYCFKPKKERFFCFFFIGRKIIITSGHTKKKQKLDRNELSKAVQIRAEYIKGGF